MTAQRITIAAVLALGGSTATAEARLHSSAAEEQPRRASAATPDLRAYDDAFNTRFCTHIDHATPCRFAHFCGDDRPCPEGMACMARSECHLHDMIEMRAQREHEEDDHDLASLDADDPIRFHSCGTSAAAAEENCGAWCWGQESECPYGQGCFLTSSCYMPHGLG